MKGRYILQTIGILGAAAMLGANNMSFANTPRAPLRNHKKPRNTSPSCIGLCTV